MFYEFFLQGVFMKTILKNYSFDGIESLRSVLKSALRRYTSVTPRILETFDLLGFEVSRKQNHYILITHTSFYSDKHPDRILVFSLSNTPSDKRAGLNAASTICNTILMYL